LLLFLNIFGSPAAALFWPGMARMALLKASAPAWVQSSAIVTIQR